MEIQSETYYQKKEEMITSINRIEQDLMNEIKPLLKSFDESMVSEKDYLQIKDFYYKKKYLLRIREQLDKFVKQ
jgi:molecular chaperone HscB